MDFLYDLMGGTYDGTIRKMGNKATPVQSILWADVDGLDALRELVRLCSMHKSVVSAKESEGGPPDMVLRPLKRRATEEDLHEIRAEEIKKERSDTWK